MILDCKVFMYYYCNNTAYHFVNFDIFVIAYRYTNADMKI